METLQEMKQVSITEIMKEHSLVVPEIQREYVWGQNDYEILDTFLEDIKKGYQILKKELPEKNPLENLLEKASEEEKIVLKSLIEKSNNSKTSQNFLNIGFLYSYKPNYYISDEGKDAYLIDGQQRFTSLFLILFYLAIKENKLSDFCTLYRFKENESKIAFDYRVRALTHNFIVDLISKTTKIEELLSIKDKSWFLSNYKKDTTVKAMIAAFKILDNHLKDENEGLYDYVKNNIKFWHFKTEETSQGEELYITMNSRGQQLADNETIRAILFKSEIAKSEPLKWSQLWEEWQDLFWKQRDKSDNSADKGFNEFLSCISGLENFLNGSHKVYTKEEFDRFKQINSSDVIKHLTLPIIEKYINALKFVNEGKEKFINNYNYYNWVDKSITTIWNILNIESTNWYADLNDSNRATEFNRMIFLWSILIYADNKKENRLDDVFRFLRLYYVRFNNFDRSVTTMLNTIAEIEIEGLFVAANLTNEEKEKHSFYNSIEDNKILKNYEQIIWEIEDHKYNLNGRDVGSINVGYLVNFKEITSISKLENIRDKFYEIFPQSQKNHFDIQNILLYYGEYWHRESPYYYHNLRFDNWRRIIRDRDHENKHTRNVFNNFFTDFTKFKGTIAEFFQSKRNSKLLSETCESLDEKLCWYNHNIGNEMWAQGNYIAISIKGNYNALPNHTSSDKIFNDYKTFYNTKGNLKGGNPKKLSQLLPKKK